MSESRTEHPPPGKGPIPASFKIMVILCIAWSLADAGLTIPILLREDMGNEPWYDTWLVQILYWLIPVFMAVSFAGGLGSTRWVLLAWIALKYLYIPYVIDCRIEKASLGVETLGVVDALGMYIKYVLWSILYDFPTFLFGIPVFVLSFRRSARDYFRRATNWRRRLIRTS